MEVKTYIAESEPYKDYELYLDDAPDGFDWKVFLFFDYEEQKISNPTFFKSPSNDKVMPFEETDDAPPLDLINAVERVKAGNHGI